MMLIGILLILIGLMLPSLSHARGRAFEAKCLMEMRDNAVMLHLYGGENRDSWPMGFERGEGGWEGARGAALQDNEEYLSVAMYWPLAMRESYKNDSLHPALMCPADGDTEAMLDEVGEQLGVDPHQLLFPQDRVLSMAFYAKPGWLRGDVEGWDHAGGTVGKISMVRYPSSKAAIFDGLPYHDERWVSVYEPSPLPPYRISVAAVDTSAAFRGTDEVLPVVLTEGPFEGEISEVRRAMGVFGLTKDGWLGRDW